MLTTRNVGQSAGTLLPPWAGMVYGPVDSFLPGVSWQWLWTPRLLHPEVSKPAGRARGLQQQTKGQDGEYVGHQRQAPQKFGNCLRNWGLAQPEAPHSPADHHLPTASVSFHHFVHPTRFPITTNTAFPLEVSGRTGSASDLCQSELNR